LKRSFTNPIASARSENEAIGQNQVLYRSLIDSLTDYAVFAISPSGKVISWNAGAEKTFGYSESEIVGRSFSIIFTEEDRLAGAAEIELGSAITGKECNHDRWHVRKDGTRFWGTNTLNPLLNQAGALLGFTKLVHDVTISHIAVEELSDSEQQLRLLIESASETAIFSIDLDGTVTSWNSGAAKMFGHSAAEIIGLNFSLLFVPEDVIARVPAIELREAALQGFFNSERRLLRKGGATFLASGTLNQLKADAMGQLRGFVKIAHDITDQNAALQNEQTWSARFQRAVLPLNLPLVSGLKIDALYEPGAGDAHVGGDWYDAVRLLDGRVLVTIGDVAGRGLEAAVVVGVVRQIMRGIAQLHADPALVLDAADRALALEYPDIFVTAWVGVLDLATRTITYACAGHPPALLASINGSTRELGDPGLPIGLRVGVRGVSRSVPWPDGETLVLYTDGLTEATRDVVAGSALVYEAAAALGSEAWNRPAERIKQAVIPEGSADDVAILVVRVDYAAFEKDVYRWHVDALDAFAATELRKKFAASLPHEDFSTIDVANAELVFGELLGNVVRHARGNCNADIVVDHSGPRTVLHVVDSGIGFRYVSRLAPDPYSEHGRGLFLIAAMTADFQVDACLKQGSHARAVLQGRFQSPFREVPSRPAAARSTRGESL
jgi:PAS domain S-box-containing protein